MFGRVLFSVDSRMGQPLRAGDGFVGNPAVKNFAAETDETITTAELGGGSIQQGTTLTSDVIYTLPTSVLVEAEFPEMDIGDCFPFEVTNAQAGAFDVVIAVGVGMTAIGANNSLSVPPQSTRWFKLIKTSNTTHDLF